MERSGCLFVWGNLDHVWVRHELEETIPQDWTWWRHHRPSSASLLFDDHCVCVAMRFANFEILNSAIFPSNFDRRRARLFRKIEDDHCAVSLCWIIIEHNTKQLTSLQFLPSEPALYNGTCCSTSGSGCEQLFIIPAKEESLFEKIE